MNEFVDPFSESTEGEVTAGGSAGSEPAVAEGSTPSSPISPSVDSALAGTSGGIPESQTTEAISAPAKTSAEAAEKMKALIKTPEDVKVVLTERVGSVGDLAVTGTGLAEPDPVQPPARSASKGLNRRKKEKAPKGDGRCSAYAPFGTKCKLCGKVHPT